MYQYTLTISFFIDDAFLRSELHNVHPLKGFIHSFRPEQTFSFAAVEHSDIIILDTKTPHTLESIREHCTKEALLVLCDLQDTVLQLSASTLSVLDDLWIKPLSASLLVFQFQKLLKLIKWRKDCWLNETYLDTAINSIPDLVWFKDLNGSHLKVNDGFCCAVGKPKEAIQGRGHYYIWDIPQEEYAKGEYVCLETEEIVLKARKTCLFDEKVKSKNGMRQFKTYKSPLFDEYGAIMGTVGIAHDVTDLQNMDTELEIILRSIPFAILVEDEDGSIIKINKKFEDYFHLQAHNILGRSYTAWKTETLKDISSVGREGYTEATLRLGDDIRILELHEEPIYDVFHNAVGQLCLCRDITIERTFEQQILHLANTDALTGLYTRRYFYATIEEQRGLQQVSLLFLDIDNFKDINDNYGHHVGDEVLIAVSRSIQYLFPEELVSRLGGDEFIVALIGTKSVEELQFWADKLLTSLHSFFCTTEKFHTLSASIGIALTIDPHLPIDALIKQSDMALYESKRRGKAQYCFFTTDGY